MKIAKVIPIFKNDDETLFCNYIPISLLSVKSKVVEKAMHNQIYNFFTGLKSGHSTEYAIMEVVDRTITSLHSNETSINIFLDLLKHLKP